MPDRKPPPDPLEETLSRLFAEPSSVPTSGLGRLARTAWSGLGLSARMALGRRSAEDFLPVVRSLGELKGLSMKLGQILSYVDDTLPPELQQLLATLQTQSPPAAFEAIAAVVRSDLGARAEELLARMDQTPVAAASIGQVHRALLPDGMAVAVKVQYPEIAEAIRNDFRAAAVAMRAVKHLAPGAEEMVEEARERLSEECDYLLEAERQARFFHLYSGHPVLRVPAVRPDYSGRRVLSTGWCEGRRFGEWLAGDPPQAERNRVGEALYEFYLGTLYRCGVFNADPHPGNYLFAADGGVIMLDYGCVREFSPSDVRAFAALRASVVAGDTGRMRDALAELGASPGSAREFEPVRALLQAFFGPTIEDRVSRIQLSTNTELRRVISDKKTVMRLRLPAQFLFLFRIKFGLHAVLARIGAEANWHRLEEGWLSGG
jgi:predicted unusual protein kinase regulating ubiquinone biosynthesis (AarF/ABC1/UbiB family)